MGITSRIKLGCHTCKRRHVSGSYSEAKRVGWVMMLRSKLGNYIWLCPTCAKKHKSTELPYEW